MSSIKAEDLQKVVANLLEKYKEDIEEDVINVVDDITKKARDELKETSPRAHIETKKYNEKHLNKYYKGWTIKLSKRKDGAYHKVIWNKTNYQLTHLLEFGHVTRNGSRTKAIPHIRPVEKKYNTEFVNKLKEEIRRTSK